ncbi:MAG TPA: acyl-CoA-binding protein [Saprospiraceae bacterium]|nr:acyl-CoA-binding protein [Saprospiraceae bacterium]
MTINEKFEQAVGKAKSLPKQSNETLLKIYALFKQAKNGDVSGKRPGAFSLKARAKYDAWAERKGMATEEAKKQYIALIDQLENA